MNQIKRKNYSEKLIIAANQNVKERNFWINQLSGELLKVGFPYDQKNSKNKKQHRPARLEFRLQGKSFSNLLGLSNHSDARLHMILAALLNVLLYKYTGSRDILVGTPIYKQEQEIETEFINTVLALRNRIQDNITFKDLLLQVRQTIVEATENQNYPIEVLKDRLNIPVSGDDFPLFDIALLLENIHDKNYILHMNLNMIFFFLRRKEYLELVVEYNSLLWKKNTIERIIDCFNRLIPGAVENVNIKIGEIDILAEAERKKLLYDFNNTTPGIPVIDTLHELFEKQVNKTPDNIAVLHQDNHVTYAELNKKANRLGWLLRTMGVKRDRIVGIMLNRSMEMIEAMLAVLKAGGTYLPIDPEYPGSRIFSILKDSEADILLTGKEIFKEHSFTLMQNLHEPRVKPRFTGKRPPISDLDSLPVVDRSLVNYDDYMDFIGQGWVKHSIALFTTRGCPYQCAYCHQIWPKKHRVRSAENIFNELLIYYQRGVKRFVILDDIFNFHKENSSRFFKLIVENKLELQLYFPSGMRADILTKDYIDLMVEAGTVYLGLALETASPRLQKFIKKNLKLETFKENLEYFCQTYPNVVLELYTMHGLPTETKEEALMTLDFLVNTRWAHFPYINILRIYPNTDMEQLALENGISSEAIFRSEHLYFHELPETLIFDKNFTLEYQTNFLNNYFLSRERLLHVLPHQMRVLTEAEIVNKYKVYLSAEISTFDQLLEFVGITREELEIETCLPDEQVAVPHLHEKIKAYFQGSRQQQPGSDSRLKPLKVLLLDLSQFFSHETDRLEEVFDPPLGLMYLLTYLNHRLGNQVKGKIVKSRVDFDSYTGLKVLVDEFQPDVIGIRTLTHYKDFFHQSIALLRHWGVRVPVIAGGPYATTSYEFVLQDRNIDLVVLGEGEVTFCQLIEKMIENGGTLPGEKVLQEISGIAFVPGKEKTRKQFAREILMMEELTGKLSALPGENLLPGSRPGDLAYIIYTSGSTGTPKGVMVQHKNVINTLNWFVDRYGLNSQWHVIQMNDIYFDTSVEEIYGALQSGSTLHVPAEQTLLDKEELISYLEKHHINIAQFVPETLKAFLSDVKKLGCLRVIICGGDKLEESLKDAVIAKGYNLHNHYGPTEITVDAAASYCDRSKVRIGKPITNVRAYIVDQRNNLQPIGVPGELCIGGAGVARGYLNKPELTWRKFQIPIPKSQINNAHSPHSPLYHTGDLARWLDNGTIEFLGRKDHQYKIRGYRVELGEIETHLLKHKEIEDTVVIAADFTDTGTPGVGRNKAGKYLCAYYVTAGGQDSLDNQEIWEYLQQLLPGYMIPSYFVQLEKIPITSTGKLDRKALPEPGFKEAGKNYIAPRTPTERELSRLWAEVLNIPAQKISIEDNFFLLGGHSLNATALISKIHKGLDAKIPMHKLFETPTIAGLTQYIQEAVPNKCGSIRAIETKKYYPLSSAQKRLYFNKQMNVDSLNYHMSITVILEGEVDRNQFEKIIKKLIARHENLRTSFVIVEEVPVQQIHQEVEFAIRYYELNEEEARQAVWDFKKTFDIKQAPLIRLGLIKTAQKRYILMLDCHHIIMDGISMDIFINELMALNRKEQLPPIKLQYKDFSEWQNNLILSGKIKKQEDFWLREFKDEIPVLNLPLDYRNQRKGNFESGGISFEIGNKQANALKKLALDNDSTLFILLLTIYNVLLSKISGQEDIVVGTVSGGRQHPDLENTMGFFTNTLALRNYPAAGKSFSGLLNEIKHRTLKAFDNQDYQFEYLVEKVVTRKDARRNPLFDVVFSMQDMKMSAAHEPGLDALSLRMKPYPHGPKPEIPGFYLILRASDSGGPLLVSLQYASNLFKEETIHRFAGYFKEIVDSILDGPHRKLSQILVMKEQTRERQMVLSDFNVDLEMN